jgi:bifunctional non-homologous end joining protein LigD
VPPDTALPIRVQGKEMTLTNPQKVLYPAAGFTKAAMIDYYVKIAPALMPHLSGRPLTMKRYPDGVRGMFFYEKNCPAYRPHWMEISRKHAREGHKDTRYCVIDSVPSLVWVANLASIELHTLLSKAEDPERPTQMVFDLDPGPSTTILDAVWAAGELRKMLRKEGLESFPKTSGSKGIHLSVPLNSAVDFEATKTFSRRMAMELEARVPERITSNMRKALRAGKIFVDWSQNSRDKTTVCAYSLRAKERPWVSTPVGWDELERAAKKKDPEALSFGPETVLKRIEKYGDLFKPVTRLKQRLPA